MILELKDKAKSALSSFGEVSSQADDVAEVFGSSNTSEAVAALTMLGYSQSEAALAVSKVDASLPTDLIIKQCLKLLSRQV